MSFAIPFEVAFNGCLKFMIFEFGEKYINHPAFQTAIVVTAF